MEKNYTGLKVGLPLSTPTNISLYINGLLHITIDLWKNNLSGKKVRKAYEKEKINLQKYFENLKNDISIKLKKDFPDREIFFDNNFCYTGKTSAQWGGNSDDYKGIKYYFSTPSPSKEGDKLILIWTFKTEEGNNF